MNCKQGDLAIVVGDPIHNGKVMKCIRWIGEMPEWWVEKHGWRPTLKDYWETDHRGFSKATSDAILHPIRGTPETEDTDEREPITA